MNEDEYRQRRDEYRQRKADLIQWIEYAIIVLFFFGVVYGIRGLTK